MNLNLTYLKALTCLNDKNNITTPKEHPSNIYQIEIDIPLSTPEEESAIYEIIETFLTTIIGLDKKDMQETDKPMKDEYNTDMISPDDIGNYAVRASRTRATMTDFAVNFYKIDPKEHLVGKSIGLQIFFTPDDFKCFESCLQQELEKFELQRPNPLDL